MSQAGRLLDVALKMIETTGWDDLTVVLHGLRGMDDA